MISRLTSWNLANAFCVRSWHWLGQESASIAKSFTACHVWRAYKLSRLMRIVMIQSRDAQNVLNKPLIPTTKTTKSAKMTQRRLLPRYARTKMSIFYQAGLLRTKSLSMWLGQESQRSWGVNSKTSSNLTTGVFYQICSDTNQKKQSPIKVPAKDQPL